MDAEFDTSEVRQAAAARKVKVRITISADLLSQVDAVAGVHGRSVFITQAIAEELRRERQARLLREFAGSLADEDIPGWETRESTVAWVRKLRDADNQRLNRLGTDC